MSEAPAPAHETSQPSPTTVAPLYKRAVSRIPPKARPVVVVAVLLAIAWAVYLWSYSGGDASLAVVCRHDLRSGRISVLLDGESIYTGKLSGVERRRFGVLDKKVEGVFSKTLKVSSGEHIVAVNITSDNDAYDLTRQTSVNLTSGRMATLRVSAQRGSLVLAYQGATPSSAPPSSGTPDYIRPLRSILFTAAGSVASAAIGFMVQEFLKSRKAVAAAKRQTPQPEASAVPADRA